MRWQRVEAGKEHVKYPSEANWSMTASHCNAPDFVSSYSLRGWTGNQARNFTTRGRRRNIHSPHRKNLRNIPWCTSTGVFTHSCSIGSLLQGCVSWPVNNQFTYDGCFCLGCEQHHHSCVLGSATPVLLLWTCGQWTQHWHQLSSRWNAFYSIFTSSIFMSQHCCCCWMLTVLTVACSSGADLVTPENSHNEHLSLSSDSVLWLIEYMMKSLVKRDAPCLANYFYCSSHMT